MKMTKQLGSTMILTLIILSVLIVSSIAFVTSTQVTNVIAGNMAFKNSTSAVGDVGIDIAINALNAIPNHDVTIPNQYYALQLPLDNDGLPNNVDWDNVPTTVMQNYNLQYVIERLCSGATPVTNFEENCSMGNSQTITSKKLGGVQVQVVKVYYRVTARVTGPRNSRSFIQAIVSQEQTL